MAIDLMTEEARVNHIQSDCLRCRAIISQSILLKLFVFLYGVFEFHFVFFFFDSFLKVDWKCMLTERWVYIQFT
jgi:hypothetical protein